jgi:hypothetical protein
MKSIICFYSVATIFAVTAVSAAAAPPADVQSAAPAVPASPSVFVNGIRREDEIVVVNTRNLCGVCDPESIRTGIQFENYAVYDEVGYRRWQSSDLAGFLAFDPSVRTVFFVHGNQITPGDAKHDGLEVYRRLMCYGANDARIRFVIFSWPSAKVAGPLRDFQIKAARTGPAGIQLAWLMDQMPAETPVSLLGFSYGARIVTGGLHVLAGGDLGGSGLPEHAHSNRAPVNAVLMAAAMHACWLGEGQYHGLALSQVDRVFFINSRQDPAMRFYALSVPGPGGPQAMGLCGPMCLSAEQAAKVYNRDISGYTGSRHHLYLYLSPPGATGQIWDYLSGTAN